MRVVRLVSPLPSFRRYGRSLSLNSQHIGAISCAGSHMNCLWVERRMHSRCWSIDDVYSQNDVSSTAPSSCNTLVVLWP